MNPATVTGTFGSFAIARDNTLGELTVTYTLSASDDDTVALDDRDFGYDMLTVVVNDGTAGNDSHPATVLVTISGDNDAPTAANVEKDVPAMPYEFSIADFAFSDADRRDALVELSIETLPQHGTLKYAENGSGDSTTDVAVDHDLLRIEIPTLVYETSTSGTYTDDMFTFKVEDGTDESATFTMTLDFA